MININTREIGPAETDCLTYRIFFKIPLKIVTTYNFLTNIMRKHLNVHKFCYYKMKWQIKLCIIPDRNISWLYIYDSKITGFFFLNWYCSLFNFSIFWSYFWHSRAKPFIQRNTNTQMKIEDLSPICLFFLTQIFG